MTWKVQEVDIVYDGYDRWDGPSQADIDHALNDYQRELLRLEARMAKAAGYKSDRIKSFSTSERVKKKDRRSCYHEEETKQFLGQTKEIVNQKEVYKGAEKPSLTPSVITKRFKY